MILPFSPSNVCLYGFTFHTFFFESLLSDITLTIPSLSLCQTPNLPPSCTALFSQQFPFVQSLFVFSHLSFFSPLSITLVVAFLHPHINLVGTVALPSFTRFLTFARMREGPKRISARLLSQSRHFTSCRPVSTSFFNTLRDN